jgi:L-alanine-DL-glutamate epimerase-like enolase superfamily enzyme
MRVAAVETVIVSVPYRHREVSALVARDGVTDVLVKVTTDEGHVGWGEACSGADAPSVERAVQAMVPFVVGRDPWDREVMRAELYWWGLWQFRPMTGNFAWAGLDMALADLCGKACDQPLHRLYGGLQRQEATYFHYLSRGEEDDLRAQVVDGLARGFEVFYLKVGVDIQEDEAMVATVRDAVGPAGKVRIDANAAWTPGEARRNLERLSAYDIDFCEQPVRESPIEQMRELRAQTTVALAANEGLWTEDDAYARIKARAQDILCFSPYWVGSLGAFSRLSHVAALEGMPVCKHTHGELGIAAAATHHVLLTLPAVVEGHQHTASMMEHDVLVEPLPIVEGPSWGVPQGPGLGVHVDEVAVAEAARRYEVEGQYLPWQPEMLGRGR